MRKTLSNTAYALGVGEHPGDLWGIRYRDEDNLAKLGLGFVCLRGKDVAHLGLAALEFAGTSDLEALGRTAVCLQLWHGVPNGANCYWTTSFSIAEGLAGGVGDGFELKRAVSPVA
jgi:hypothetical protein